MRNLTIKLFVPILLGGVALFWVVLSAAPPELSQPQGGSCCASKAPVSGSTCPHLTMVKTSQSNKETASGSAKLAFSPAAKEVFENYLIIQERLASDRMEGVSIHAGILVASALRDPDLPANVSKYALALSVTKDLPSARQAFRTLSASLIPYARRHKSSIPYVEVYCGMAKASWLQSGLEVRNPYYGSSMLTCGTVQGA